MLFAYLCFSVDWSRVLTFIWDKWTQY